MPRPCLEPGCPHLVRNGRCRACALLHAARQRARVGWIYDDPRWARARGRALKRAEGCCEARDRGTRCSETVGLHGHHAYPGGAAQMLRDGEDPFDPGSIVVLCSRHHGQLEAWLRAQARNPSIRR